MSKLPAIGDEITFRKTMTVAEQGFFTGISGNMTRHNVDRVDARARGQADMVVFELAAAALFTTALGRLAGPGWRIGEISFDFARALAVGASLAATARVETASGSAIACTLAASADGVPAISGRAVLVPLEG